MSAKDRFSVGTVLEAFHRRLEADPDTDFVR